MQANPAVDMTFTMTGSSLSSRQPGLSAGVPEGPDAAPADRSSRRPVDGRDRHANSRHSWRSCSPIRCCRSAPARPRNTQGQFAYALSGIDPNEVYAVAGKLMQKMFEYPGFLFVTSDLFNHTPNLERESAARPGQDCTAFPRRRILSLLHNAYSQNYTYLDQEAQRPVPGDPRGGGRGSVPSPRI